MSVSVILAVGAAPEPADEQAAQALAQVLARSSLTDTAVTRDTSGAYVVMSYADWKRRSLAGGDLADWKLKGVAWAAA